MKNLQVTFVAAIALVMGMTAQNAFAFPSCSFGHCTSFDSLLKKVCAKKYGKPVEQLGAEHTVDSYDDNSAQCTCPCSCVSAETLVELFEGDEIMARTVRKDDTLRLPQADRTDGVVFGVGGARVEKTEVQQIVFDNDRVLTVSPNHTFVNMNGKLITAEKVKNGQLVMGTDGKALTALQSRRIKNFTGSLHNFIVNEKSSKPKDHLISTSGVQSGDWLLQSTQDTMKQEIDLRLGKVQTLSEILN